MNVVAFSGPLTNEMKTLYVWVSVDPKTLTAAEVEAYVAEMTKAARRLFEQELAA